MGGGLGKPCLRFGYQLGTDGGSAPGSGLELSHCLLPRPGLAHAVGSSGERHRSGKEEQAQAWGGKG